MELGTIDIFQIVFTIAAGLFVIIFIPVAFQLFTTMKSINKLVKNLSDELTPALGKLQIAVDQVVEDLKHIDDIFRTTTEITHKIDRTLEAAQNVISSPILKYTSIAFTALRAILAFRKGRSRK
jgi:predicted PurR-regulated permease PerM